MSTATERSDGHLAFDGCWENGAFSRVYQQHSGAVYAVASRVACPGTAEDLTQEVFLQLWRHPDRYDPARGSLHTFLLTVTYNLAVETIRFDRSRRAPEERHAARPDNRAPADEADQRPLHADRRSMVDRALDHLNDDERAAIVTAHYGGCTYREAARVLGLAEGTLKARIRTGLRHLHDAITTTTPVSTGSSRSPTIG